MVNLLWLAGGALLAVVGVVILLGLAPQGGTTQLNILGIMGLAAVIAGVILVIAGIWSEHFT